MEATNAGNNLVLTFTLFESRLLQHILKQIIANYQIKPERLDAKSAAAWYSTQGCQTADMSADETHDWLETLHQYKSANVQLLTKWFRRLAVPKTVPSQLRIKLEDVSVLLTALNDHRLLKAAQHDIGQPEMDLRTVSAFNELDLSKQKALCEIEFLAGLIDQILKFLPGNPGNWQGSGDVV